jgi:hypothetical protein
MNALPDHVVADLQTTIVQRDGKVHVLFSRDVEGELKSAETNHVLFPAATALDVGQMIIDLAFEADTGLKPLGPAAKAELVKKHREKLIPRIGLMLNSMREKKTVNNSALARQIMDTVCAEVFP